MLDLAWVQKELEYMFQCSNEPPCWHLMPWDVCLKGCVAIMHIVTHCQAMLYLVTSEQGLKPQDLVKQQWQQVRTAFSKICFTHWHELYLS
jgi:hypothetical protein